MKMSLDTSGVKAGLAKAKNGIKSFSTSAISALKTVATGGIAAIAAGFAVAARSSMLYGKEMLNLSALANTSFEDFQKLAVGAKTVGVEQDKLADILKDTSDKIGDFLETGGGAMADYFENIAPLIGQTAEEFRGLSGADALQKYYDGLQQANLDQETMTFYMEAIASDSAALIPLLHDGGSAFKSMGQEAKDAGLLMEQETAESLKRAEDSIDKLKQKATIGTGIILRNLAWIGRGGKLEENKEETARDDARAQNQYEAVALLQEEGAEFSDANIRILSDTSTDVDELTRILDNYGLKLYDLYDAAAFLRKEEKAGAKELAEAAKKETAEKVAKLELAKKELALVKPLKKAKEELAKAEEYARVSGLSESEKLDDLKKQRVEIEKNIKWLEKWKKASSESDLEQTIAKKKLLDLDKEIQRSSENVAKNKQKALDDQVNAEKKAKARADKAIDDAKDAREKADDDRKKAIEDAETKVDQGLQSDLLDAQISQRADVVHSVEKEIEMRERIKQIVADTGESEIDARIAAEAMMKIEAGADLNQSGFVTPLEQRKWNREQKALAREQKKINREEQRAERERGGNIKKALGGREAAEARANERREQANKRELDRRRRRGEKAEDVLKEFAERKLKKEDEVAKKQGKEAVANLKKAREEAKAAAGKAPKKPENAVVKGLKPTLEKQLAELKKINKALKCEG